MDRSFLFIVVAVIVVLAVVLVLSYYQKQRRITQMRAVAVRLGYEYAEAGPGLANRLAGFALFSRGHSGTMTNLLSTEANGFATLVADYVYEIGYGKNRRIRRQSVLLLESARMHLPAFVLRPEGLGQKLVGLLGQQDIDFDDQPEFSAAYLLQGPDESQIRALFGREKLAFLARRPGLCIEGQGQRLLYYRAKKLVAPEAIPSFVEEGLAVLHLLAGEEAPPPAREPDPLAGLDEVLADIGLEEGAAAGGE